MFKGEVIGRLGADATAQEYQGREFVSFNVAYKSNKKDEFGQWRQQSEWVQVSWNGNGGRLLPYLKKGAKVFVRGEVKPNRYTNNSGEVHLSIKILASEVVLCGVREDSQKSVSNGER